MSTGWSMGYWLDAEAPYVPFLADRGCGGGAIINGLDADDLNDVLPSCVFAILAAWSWAAFSLNRLAYVIMVFPHAKASHYSTLIVITPLGPCIFNVA
jgi:hypothetical protein